MGELRYCTTGVVLYLELADVFINSPLQVAIDAFYDTSCGHEEGIHESVPAEETRPPSPRTSHSWDHPPPCLLLLQTSRENIRSTTSDTWLVMWEVTMQGWTWWTCYICVHSNIPAPHSLSLSLSTVPLDPTQPTTTVQIQLADGTRLVSKFNHTHTVNDIRQFINLYPQTCLHFIASLGRGLETKTKLMFKPARQVIIHCTAENFHWTKFRPTQATFALQKSSEE